jgi:hypothetical protein
MKKFLLNYVTIMLTLVFNTNEALPCKLFPKIFGSSKGDTVPKTMDANLEKNIYVVGGYTNDYALAGL